MHYCINCHAPTKAYLLGKHRSKEYYLCHVCQRTLNPKTIATLKEFIKNKELEWYLEQMKEAPLQFEGRQIA